MKTQGRLRINDFIRSLQIRLIDSNGEFIGIVSNFEAKKTAREANLDLVEINPTTKPPICKIMDYGKWKYQKKRDQKSDKHSQKTKEIKLRPTIDTHDKDVKLRQARGFLESGMKVQFVLSFKGREITHRGIGFDVMNYFKDNIADIGKIDSGPTMVSRRIMMAASPLKPVKA